MKEVNCFYNVPLGRAIHNSRSAFEGRVTSDNCFTAFLLITRHLLFIFEAQVI